LNMVRVIMEGIYNERTRKDNRVQEVLSVHQAEVRNNRCKHN